MYLYDPCLRAVILMITRHVNEEQRKLRNPEPNYKSKYAKPTFLTHSIVKY
jgi:hypothetical protein